MSGEKPTEPGKWSIKCMETDYEWEEVTIYESKHGLMVDCPHLGKVLLDYYHDGLTQIEWKKNE